MTKKHPLTDEICDQITDKLSIFSIEDCMRDAADWQLEQVMKWLDENLSNYTDDTYLGDCEPMSRLTHDLEGAIRSTQKTSREGALQALDRLYEENSEAMKRLAQEDN